MYWPETMTLPILLLKRGLSVAIQGMIVKENKVENKQYILELHSTVIVLSAEMIFSI